MKRKAKVASIIMCGILLTTSLSALAGGQSSTIGHTGLPNWGDITLSVGGSAPS